MKISLNVAFWSLFFAITQSAYGNGGKELPNVIIIVADDLGYGDLSCYGSTSIKTPNIDRMAAEGMRFTDYYVTSGVCTPSRSSIMTGCYPIRVGLAAGYSPSEKVETGGNKTLPYGVLFPFSDLGLHPDEVTIAELMKKQGYSTGHIGKWHLGHRAPFLPTKQGFDYYFGIPYSNDMGNNNYGNLKAAFISGPTPIYRNDKVIEVDPDQSLLTRRYTEEAVDFITTHRKKPFFLYLAHAMPHMPVAASHHFKAKSDHGLYGDAVEELDWSVGYLLQHLTDLGLSENTIVIFTSDNGAAVWEGNGGWAWTPEFDGKNNRRALAYRSGSNKPLRGSKGTTWEGGMRVPFIARWPARIQAGKTASQLTTSMDLLPTLASIAGTRSSAGRPIDGHDIREILFAVEAAKSPYEVFYYYRYERLQAVRSGEWKLHVFRPETGKTTLLYNLITDIGETTDVSDAFPEVVEALQVYADKARFDLGDAVTGHTGKGIRSIGKLSAE